ncbi:MAG: DUF521 domain-containing protein [Deltaproteobacteria bacterium]|uniref:DUF521 domain-containing protein n=1 Tax=Candidatus Zymogenus saltonus TaxID=2844893 RepID=A0A9D8KDY0_9DELT|nr:DUF521 domain-containing protein [Candidatus Zymogenus saltonus]
MKKGICKLTQEEERILKDDQNTVLGKILRSVILYGEAFGADRLVPVAGTPHFAMSFGASIITPYYKVLDEIIEAGLKPKISFTTNPRTYDFKRIPYSFLEKVLSKFVYGSQPELERKLQILGIISSDTFSCACYLPEVGNIPKKGEVLAWSESSAVVFANSVLGARTNRNSVGIDVLMNIIGKAPYFGFLTDEGRKASWLVELKTSELPNPQVLGSAIGMKVMEDVPYIVGLDTHFKNRSTTEIRDYMKDMGAASASNGAVGLFHVENITPEAKDDKRKLISKGFRNYTVDDCEIERIVASYPVLWKNPNGQPKRCLIGCPHLSFEQVSWWIENISGTLQKKGRNKVKIQTILNAPPAVVKKFDENRSTSVLLKRNGIVLSSICPVAFMSNPLSAKKPTITNSNKLRTYTTARFCNDDDVLDIITG